MKNALHSAVWSGSIAFGMILLACGPHVPSGQERDGGMDGTVQPDRMIGDGTVIPDAQGPECSSNDDCDGGFCVSGHCCPTREQVCGQACCGTDQVCFANACVTPGDVCHSAGDCGEDEYCEFGLGEDAGVGDAGTSDGGICLRPAPSGRCVALPPKCDADGGVPDGGICIQDCEYHPESGGPLHAEAKWSWDPDTVVEYPDFVDVWATPAVGRLYDTNCDGEVNELDPPNVVFVSGNARGTCCSCGPYTPSTCLTGVLRVLDGLSGQEVWSLRRAEPGSIGFAGLSVALGDVNRDGTMEIVAVTGEGKVAVIDSVGNVVALSNEIIQEHNANAFGWGGGLAIADMDGDGNVEVAYGRSLFTITSGGVTRLFEGTGGRGGGAASALSLFADMDMQTGGDLELVAGNTVYRKDGTILWQNTDLPDGYDAVADLNSDGLPEVVLVAHGQVWVLDGATGTVLLGPATLPGTGSGGPPTVADFDGDGQREIGVAQANYYSVLKPNWNDGSLDLFWNTPNHDLSSSVTGSTVFDFEGDGAAEVVYNDECFLWVFDGTTGEVRFAALTASFTATESSLLADVDGDGHAEMVMIANGANPSSSGWKCDVAPWNQPGPNGVRPAWVPPSYGPAYRGIKVFGDRANSWVGTRTLWNEHSYHVTNICDPRDGACNSSEPYGAIPYRERANWVLPWLNNFRQNVQDQGLFNAPDGTLEVVADCSDSPLLHAFLRNIGAALLPSGVVVAFYVDEGGGERSLGEAQTTTALFPGQVAELTYQTTMQDNVTRDSTFFARIEIDPNNVTFHQCREDNDESAHVKPNCAIVE